jgi:hypothetical protein
VDFIAGAVEEAGVDEKDAILRRADAFLEVHRGAAFLIHDAHFEGVCRQAKCLSMAPNKSLRNATSSGPCIFGLTI